MKPYLSPSDISSSVILFFVTGSIVYGILRNIKPSYIMKNSENFSRVKLIFYSCLLSVLFTLGTVLVSVKIDKLKKKK